MDSGKNDPSILKRVFTNKRILIGFLCLFLAFGLALVAVTQKTFTDTELGQLDESNQLMTLPEGYNIKESELTLTYETENSSDELILQIENGDFDNIKNVTLYPHSPKKIDLTSLEGNPTYVYANITEGKLRYTHKLEYTNHPYAILSIPAIVLTVVGVIYSHIGKNEVLSQIKIEKRKQEAAKKDVEEGSQEEDKVIVEKKDIKP